MEWLTPPMAWFLIGFVFIGLEFIFPSLVKVFFGLGAWTLSLITLFMPLSLNVQLFLFIISSVAYLLLLRRTFKAFLHRKSLPAEESNEELEEFIGQSAVVVQPISPRQKGRVAFRGTEWDAEAFEEIPAGTSVEIIDKKNITLIVKSF